MIHPLLYLIGYSIISLCEEDSVKFINGAARSGIVYHDMGASGGRRHLRLSPIACVRACELCRMLGLEVCIEERRGLPYLCGRTLRRPGLLAGCVLFALCVFFSQRLVWDIRIEGNPTVPDEVITDTLRECGFGVGTPIGELDIDGIENRFLILSDDISWITVNVIGTVAEVEVREVTSAEPTPDYICSNLVATRNGKVVEFFQVRGDIQVVIGEEVSEGQLLVGGVYGSDTSPMRFVRSRGEVLAQCDRDYSVDVPLEYEKKVYTGEQKIKKSLIFFEKEVKFFGNSGNSYASCDTIEEVEYLDFFGLGKLPFAVRTVTYMEYETQSATRSEEEAEEEATYLLWNMFSNEAPDAQVVGKKIHGELSEYKYTLTATVTTIENIAEEREVEIDILSR